MVMYDMTKAREDTNMKAPRGFEKASYNGVLVYKKKGAEAWKVPYVYAGRSSDITID